MNGWWIVVATLALAVALMRLWFRWFSRRPLSRTDEYAGTVDSAVDDRPTGPTTVSPSVPATPSPTTSPRATSPTATAPTATSPTGADPVRPRPRPAGAGYIPQQRSAADAAGRTLHDRDASGVDQAAAGDEEPAAGTHPLGGR